MVLAVASNLTSLVSAALAGKALLLLAALAGGKIPFGTARKRGSFGSCSALGAQKACPQRQKVMNRIKRFIIKTSVGSSESERHARGNAIPVIIPERKIRVLQQELIAQIRPPVLMELIAGPQTSYVISVVLPEGAPKFLGEMD